MSDVDKTVDTEVKQDLVRLTELFMAALNTIAGQPTKVLVMFAPPGQQGDVETTQLTMMSNIEPDDVKKMFADLGKDLDTQKAKESREAHRLQRIFEQVGGGRPN
jgi:hypothetical protein